MKKLLTTVMVIMLALGLMGIILGISVGLYRNDRLAQLQEIGSLEENLQKSGNYTSAADLLLRSNLHIFLLGSGALLTLISAALFLINLRNSM